LPTSKKDEGAMAVSSFMKTELDIHMSNLAYLNRKSGMEYSKILKLPYAVYRLMLKHHTILDLQETEEGRKYLAKVARLTNKEIDLAGLKRLGGYRTQEKAGD
jgi:hypothetical protein